MPFGLAEQEKTATIHITDGQFEGGTLAAPEAMAPAPAGATIARYECRFLSVNAFLRSAADLVADFWKVDVEGAELFVLRGASDHFAAGYRPLIVAEVYAPWERRFGYGPWEYLAPLLEMGYRFLFLCPGGLIEHLPSERSPFPAEFEHGYNVVAYVPGRHAGRIRATRSPAPGTGEALGVGRGPHPNRPLPESSGREPRQDRTG